MLKLENVNKYFFRHKNNEIHVIDNTSLEFEEKGMVALLGPSGCGKTTLLNVIGGLDKVNSGRVFVNGKKISRRPSGRIDKIRNLNIGYIFQNYNLIDNMTVFDNVAMVLKMVGIKNKEEIRRKVEYALDLVGMYRYRKRYADMLSGGERQRVGIARAIVKNPSIIIADEPTGNLDSANTLEVMNIISTIAKEKLVVLVTHEEKLAEFYADRIIRLRDGKVISDEQNEHPEGLDYRVENRIYLKDMADTRRFGDEKNNVTVYSDGTGVMDLDIVVANGNLFIRSKQAGNRVEVVDDNSSIELIDDHYRAMTKEESEAHRFHPERLKASKPLRHSSILNPFTTIKEGFKRVSNYHPLKKILLIGFLLSAMFLTYAVSNIYGVLDVKDANFVTTNKDYVRLVEKKVTVDKFLAYEQDETVEYAIPGDAKVNFNMPYDEYLQTSWDQAMLSGALTSAEDLTEEDIVYGRLPQHDYELVVDELCLVRLLKQSDANQAGYATGKDLVNKKVKLNGLPDFTIVGVTNKTQPVIYAAPNMFIQIIGHSGSQEEMYSTEMYEESPADGGEGQSGGIVDISLKKNEVTLKKGNWPINDYEVIVSQDHQEEMPLKKEIKTKVNGKKLLVVGYYKDPSGGDNYLVNSNTYKYDVISKAKNVTVKTNDKEACIASFEEQGVKAKDVYKSDRAAYRSSRMDSIKSSLITALVVIFISMIEIFLIMRASFLSRIKEIGTLRAIGVKKGDVYRMFIGEIIGITVLASLPGYALMSYIIFRLSKMSYFQDSFIFNPQVLISAAILIVGFNLLFGLLPVIRTLLKKPAAILARTDVN